MSLSMAISPSLRSKTMSKTSVARGGVSHSGIGQRVWAGGGNQPRSGAGVVQQLPVMPGKLGVRIQLHAMRSREGFTGDEAMDTLLSLSDGDF
jgi:hypothetical protein